MSNTTGESMTNKELGGEMNQDPRPRPTVVVTKGRLVSPTQSALRAAVVPCPHVTKGGNAMTTVDIRTTELQLPSWPGQMTAV